MREQMELQEVFEHPLVQDLIEQNEFLEQALPERQMLSLRQKHANLENIKVPYIIKNRKIFSEGSHNGIFYPFDEIASDEALSQIEGIDLFLAEHNDGSPAWAGVIRNPRAHNADKTIRGDLEIVDKNTAQKLAWMISKKTGTMGISPTVDVDTRALNGQTVALGPKYQSFSIVLKPADKTTLFNSEQKNGGGYTMENPDINNQGADPANAGAGAGTQENLAQIKAQKDVELKEQQAELQKKFNDQEEKLKAFEEAELVRESEPLAQLELSLGRIKESQVPERVETLKKLTSGERKILSDNYGWMIKELELSEDEDESGEEGHDDDSEKEEGQEEKNSAFTDFVKKYMKTHKGAKIGDAAKAWKKEKKGKEKNAKITPPVDDEEEEKKKKKKKYPYPEGAEKQSLPSDGGAGKVRQEMSQRVELIEEREKPINRMNLSEEQVEGNKQFIDFLQRNQGGAY